MQGILSVYFILNINSVSDYMKNRNYINKKYNINYIDR
jgi:hypothetical protein